MKKRRSCHPFSGWHDLEFEVEDYEKEKQGIDSASESVCGDIDDAGGNGYCICRRTVG